MEKSLNIAQILGPVPGDPLSVRVQLQDGTITNLSVTGASSTAINVTIAEYREVFERLADE
jgi:hypothetical protein